MLAYLEIRISDTFGWLLGMLNHRSSVLIKYSIMHLHACALARRHNYYSSTLTYLCVDGVTNSLHIMKHLALQVHLSV